MSYCVEEGERETFEIRAHVFSRRISSQFTNNSYTDIPYIL